MRRGARIAAVGPADVRPLRQRVLRPHQRAAELVFPGDLEAEALHLAARLGEGGRIVGVASWLPEGPDLPELAAARRPVRLRGMATAPELRGTGIGAALLEEGATRLAATGVDLVWCQARVAARGFYERHGFAAHGEPFELPEIGPHVVMSHRVPHDRVEKDPS